VTPKTPTRVLLRHLTFWSLRLEALAHYYLISLFTVSSQRRCLARVDLELLQVVTRAQWLVSLISTLNSKITS
jgi:hypothetical protein